METVRQVSATEAKTRLGALMDYVIERNEPVTITQRGKAVAVMIGIDQYIFLLWDEWEREGWPEEFQTFRDEVRTRHGDRRLAQDEIRDLINELG